MPPSLFRRVRLLLALAMVIPAAAPIPALGAPVSPTVLEISGGDEAAEWLAMAQAIRSTRLDVIAIVISRPAEATQAENLALRVRDLLKRPDIPVLVSDNQAIPASNLEIGNLPGKAQGEVEQGDLGERVVDLIEENGGNTQYLSTGSLGGLVASWRKSPEVLSKVRRILISGVSVDQGVLNGLSDPDGAAGELLLSTTTPLVLFPKSMTESLVFDKEDLGVLGKGRTDLTDAMTYLASRDLDQGALALDPIPMVTYAYIPSSAKLEPKDLSFTNTVGRTTQALVAVDIAREAMVDNLILELENPLIDFSLGFSHYLFGLGRLSPDSKKEISQKLRNLPAPEEVRDASALASERIRRILDYLDSSLEVIQSVKEDPAAKEVIESLNETSRRVGSIGWQFPDNFYSKWGVEVQPNGEFQMDIGLSNPYNREIQNIQFEIKVQDEIISKLEIESATGEVPFKVDARIPEGMIPQVSSVGEIAASVHFEISDVTVQTTRLIPIVVKP